MYQLILNSLSAIFKWPETDGVWGHIRIFQDIVSRDYDSWQPWRPPAVILQEHSLHMYNTRTYNDHYKCQLSRIGTPRTDNTKKTTQKNSLDWTLAYLSNRKFRGIATTPFRSWHPRTGGRWTLAATPSFPTRFLGAGVHHRSAKVFRICEWEVVQTLTLMEVSPSL